MSERWGEEHHHSTKSQQMRESLRKVGIELDDPKPAAIQKRKAAIAEPDRAAIRAVLEPLGAPEWAIASCPSLELARAYRSPR